MRAEDERVFLFEYAVSSSQPLPASVAIEGIGMFKTLYEGFENPISFYRKRSYRDAFKRYLEQPDCVLAVAPETGMELYSLTRLIEDSDCQNLGSSSEAVRVTSDKLQAHKKMRDLSPRTELCNGRTTLEFPLVAKPRDGVSCEGIMLVKDDEELAKVPSGYLVQDYVPGRPMSACVLVGDEPRILSINTQEMKGFEYTGAKLPVDYAVVENIIEAVNRISGLFGLVGVDFILTEEGPVIIEINPRPTTPIIGINRALGINISELILKNFRGEDIPQIRLKRRVQIKKTRSSRGIVSYNGYSMELSDINEDINL